MKALVRNAVPLIRRCAQSTHKCLQLTGGAVLHCTAACCQNIHQCQQLDLTCEVLQYIISSREHHNLRNLKDVPEITALEVEAWLRDMKKWTASSNAHIHIETLKPDISKTLICTLTAYQKGKYPQIGRKQIQR